jgi:molybdopterin-containing oxidoreductase family membrane subunit
VNDSTHPRAAALAQGLCRFGARSLLAAALLGALALLGVWGYLQQRMHGDIVTGMRTIGQGGSAWGLYIILDIFFVGLAFGGIAFTALVRLFRLQALRGLSRMAQLMAIVSISMAGLCVIADLGRPLHGLTNLPRYARTMSPFFGTFTLVICTGLLSALVYLWLDGRADAAWCAQRAPRLRWVYRLWAAGFRGTPAERWRHAQASFWLSLAMLPLVLISYSTLGFVFGIQGGRPGWFSALQAPGFVVLAAISSLGVLALFAALARRTQGLEEELPDEAFRLLGNALWVLTSIYLYILAVEALTNRYASSATETAVSDAIVKGRYAWLFWGAVATMALPTLLLFVQYLRRKTSIALIVACGLCINVGAMLKRFLIVVPSQTHGTLIPYRTGSYQPTWVELSAAAGLMALMVLTCLVFAQFFPLVPLDVERARRPARDEREPAGRKALRLVLAYGCVLGGLVLAGIGFASSARIWSEPWEDPLIPLSPVIFAVGMMFVFYSAAVYETLPRQRPDSRVAQAGSDLAPPVGDG